MIAHEKAPDGTGLARGMAWFGIALGAAELAAPRLIGRLIGVRTEGRIAANVMRAMGVREIATGVAVLLRRRRPRPMAMRVAGDALDLAALSAGAIARRTSAVRVGGAFASVAVATALDVIARGRLQRAFDAANTPTMGAVTINHAPSVVYEFYRRFERLPLFMDYLESVERTGPTTSRWVAKLPLGRTIAWDAEIIDDRPGELIAWRASDGSALKVEGQVSFTRAPGRNATEVRVELRLGGPGVAPSAELARLFARPQIRGDLLRLKQLLETGEVLRSDASAHAKPHPAQPSPDAEPPPPVHLRRETAQKGDVQ